MYQHRLAYIVEHNNELESIKITINFPLLPGLIKDYLRKKIALNKDRKDLSRYPAVQGYYIEAKFFNQSNLEVSIMIGDHENQSHSPRTSTILIFPGLYCL